MRWYSNLYLGERIQGKEAKVKSRVERGVPQPSLYLLTLPSNEDNLLDIIPATDLLQKAYPKNSLFIIGIEKGYDAALEMSAAIVNDIYHKTGTFEVQKYILKQQTWKNTGMENRA